MMIDSCKISDCKNSSIYQTFANTTCTNKVNFEDRPHYLWAYINYQSIN